MRCVFLLLACFTLFLATSVRAETYGPPDETALQPAADPIPSEAMQLTPEELVPMAVVNAAERATKRERERRNQRAIIPGLIAHVLVQGADGWTTIECGRASKDCHEENAPGLYGYKPKAKRVIPIKLAVTGLTGLLAWKIAKHSPTAGYALLFAIDVPTAGMVVGNLKLIR